MPIISSLFDVDFYKLTMGQLVLHRYPHVPVRYGLTCRTKGISLPQYIDEGRLRAELDHARTVHFEATGLMYLAELQNGGGRLFQDDYLGFLKNFHLPPYELERCADRFKLEFPGTWQEAIYWETIALSIITELYTQSRLATLSPQQQEALYADGERLRASKIMVLRANPGIVCSDFGTRRRAGKDWQEKVVAHLASSLPREQFIGTSNVALAIKHNLRLIGTYAHEMDMVLAGLMCNTDEELRASHQRVLADWWDEYGYGLSIALTDTYGTDFFFADMTPEQAHNWKGLRHDSGDPLAFGEKAITFYSRHGIDPHSKTLVFSDGLDLSTMWQIENRFHGRINCVFGWGTNLTNDIGIAPLSLVIKVIEANGHGTVKLSDNLAKATGSPEDIERFKRIFGYTGNTFESTRY